MTLTPPSRESAPTSRDRRVPIWDLATRLFHWLVVALIAAAYVTWRLNWMEWHARIGEAVLALVLFRLLWGFFGSDSARFGSFLASPGRAARHLATFLKREPDRQVGHNPAGGWMVLLFIGLMLGETLSGLYVMNDVADEGPLTEVTPARIADAITALHGLLWDALLAAVALHLAAILLYAVAKRQNLVRPMISGWKTLPASVPAPRLAGSLRALVLLGVSAAAAAALVRYL
jgi:cytochrome b